MLKCHRVDTDGVRIAYRESGPEDAPVIVLLHGYPSSSRMYEPLFPVLDRDYRLIAPDYPGFGLSDAPPPGEYAYTFDHLAETMERLLNALQIDRYVLFMQDYGGPVGFRLALRNPRHVRALIIQNANIYEEGLGAKWRGIARYWTDRQANDMELDAFMSLDAARRRHIGTSPNSALYDPKIWIEERAFLSRPGQREIQGDLLYDYQNNIKAYPKWQAWLRERRPPTLVLWGRYDLSFLTGGAEAFARDIPDPEIHLLDAGHFALDEKAEEVGGLVIDFLRRRLGGEEAGAS